MLLRLDPETKKITFHTRLVIVANVVLLRIEYYVILLILVDLLK